MTPEKECDCLKQYIRELETFKSGVIRLSDENERLKDKIFFAEEAIAALQRKVRELQDEKAH